MNFYNVFSPSNNSLQCVFWHFTSCGICKKKLMDDSRSIKIQLAYKCACTHNRSDRSSRSLHCPSDSNLKLIKILFNLIIIWQWQAHLQGQQSGGLKSGPLLICRTSAFIARTTQDSHPCGCHHTFLWPDRSLFDDSARQLKALGPIPSQARCG